MSLYLQFLFYTNILLQMFTGLKTFTLRPCILDQSLIFTVKDSLPYSTVMIL
jgi:hypothetical protein